MIRWISLRGRLTAVFVLASALIVALGGWALLRDQEADASNRLDDALVGRIDAVELSLRKGEPFPFSELYGEVIDGDYRTLGRSRAIDLQGLLTASQTDFVLRNGSLQVVRPDAALGGSARLLAQRRTIAGIPLVIVVGAGENSLRESHRRLLVTFAIGGPALVSLLGLAGWLLAGAALRPVKRMTDDAASISQFGAAPGSRARIEIEGRRDELWHLGSTLNGMLDRLEGSYRRERAFVDDASHELRTPLALLRGELELAVLHPGDATAMRAALKRSIDEVDRLAEMTDDLLVLARADREQAASTPTTATTSPPTSATTATTPTTPDRPPAAQCDLVDVAQRLADRENRIRVTVRSDVGTAIVPLRPARAERIVRNLVDNAQRFAESRIEVAVCRCETSDLSQGLVELVVEDDGPGFPAEFVQRAFERFSVATESRTRGSGGGVGLGLAIVRALTEEAGGSVRAEASESGGARVVVCLPLLSSSVHGRSATTSA